MMKKYIHDSEICIEINGSTWLRTNIFMKFGKVLRISGACNRIDYKRHINSVITNIIKLDESDEDLFLDGTDEYNTILATSNSN